LEITLSTISSFGPEAIPIPAQECIVFALQFNNKAAHPVKAHT